MTLLPSSTPIPTGTAFVIKIPKQNYSAQQGSSIYQGQTCPSAYDKELHDYSIQELNRVYQNYYNELDYYLQWAVINQDAIEWHHISEEMASAKSEHDSAIAEENSRYQNLCK
jgi:hypothetical protein